MNPAHKSPWLMVTIVLSAILSCDNRQESYFPSDTGSRWYYSIEKISVEGTNQLKDIVEVVKSNDAGSDRIIHLRSISGTESVIKAGPERIQLDELISAKGETIKSAVTPSTILKYPFQAGTSWEALISTSTIATHDRKAGEVIEDIPVTVKIESIGETVETNAGRFHRCMKVVSTGEKKIRAGKYAYEDKMAIAIRNTRWYAPGVGLVREEHQESSDTLNYPESGYTRTLDKFSPP